MRTAICVPTQGRPHNLARLISAAFQTAGQDLVIWAYVDDDDPSVDEYLSLAEPDVLIEVGPPRRLVPAWNYQAEGLVTDARVDQVCFWGDDVVPETVAWDVQLWTASEDGTCITYGQDGYWGVDPATPGHLMLPTAVAMSRTVIHAIEAPVPVPHLEHVYADNTWKALGITAGKLRFESDVMIRHHHPTHAVKKYRAPMDATYEKAATNDAQFRHDEQAFNAWRVSSAFGFAVERLAAL